MATASKQTTTSTQPVPPTFEPSLADTWKAFEAAFNRKDAQEVSGFWEKDGTLIGPTGNWGVGRSGVEKAYAYDVTTFLQGTRSSFEIQRVRMIGSDVAHIDLEHVLSGARMPDGTTGTIKLHLVVLARKSGDQWRWLDARPYAFLPAPSAGRH
jgi:uncharacterized protein (TIGR02246 family)